MERLDKDLIASGSDDSMIKIWNITTGQLKLSFGSILNNERDQVNSMQVLNDGRLACGYEDSSIHVYDSNNNGSLIYELKSHTDSVYALAYLNDINYLASGSWDMKVKIWNLSNGELKHTFEGHLGHVDCLISVTKDLIASGSWDGSIKIWDIVNLNLKYTLGNLDHNWIITMIALNDDQIVSGSMQDIKIWNINTGKLRYTFDRSNGGPSGWVESLLLIGLKYLAVGSDDKKIRIFDLNKGIVKYTLDKTNGGHNGQVNSLISINDRLLVSGSSDGCIKVWNIFNM